MVVARETHPHGVEEASPLVESRPRLASIARPDTPNGRTPRSERIKLLHVPEYSRKVFVQDSGTKMSSVEWVIDHIRPRMRSCVDNCSNLVVTAQSSGIPQAWEHLVSAEAEVALCTALFMALYVGVFGWTFGLYLGILNMICGRVITHSSPLRPGGAKCDAHGGECCRGLLRSDAV